jgi:hypothetical protein
MSNNRGLRLVLSIGAGVAAMALSTGVMSAAVADPGDPVPNPQPGTVVTAMSPALARSMTVAQRHFVSAAHDARAAVAPSLRSIQGRIGTDVFDALQNARNAHVTYNNAVQQGADAATLGMLKVSFDTAAADYRVALAQAQARHHKQILAVTARLASEMRDARTSYAESVRAAFATHAPGTSVPTVLLASPRIGPGPAGWVASQIALPADIGPLDSGPGTTP